MDLAGPGVRTSSADQLTEVGRFAESNGYTEVFVPDGARGGVTDPHGRLNGRDALTTLAAMFSCNASKVRGTLGVAAVPMHHRLVLPLLASTLNELSDGRFSLGIGVSHPENTAAFGVDFPTRQIDYMRDWIRDLSRARPTELAMAVAGLF